MALPPHSPATSQILSDRLNARRMDSKRARRRTDFGPIRNNDDDDIFMAEAAASSIRDLSIHDERSVESKPLQGDTTRPNGPRTRAPGLKEMDQRLQQLEKQNFDLKMEVFHRREREEKLHDQLRKMHDQVKLAQKIQDEHATLIELNKSLAVELDRSNEAVDQAVQMICDLEAQVETLQEKARVPSAHSDSGYGGSMTPSATIIPPTPPSKQYLMTGDEGPIGRVRSARSDRTPRDRIPSFMSNIEPSTLALREAYNGSTRNLRQALSFVSVVSDSTTKDDKVYDLGSPRLSALSESSFPSIYDLKQKQPRSIDGRDEDSERPKDDITPEKPRFNYQEDSIKRVSNWMQHERHHPDAQSRPTLPAQSDLEHQKYDGDSTDESRRPSTTFTEPESAFVGYPDGGSIIRGTPSRFRTQSEAPEAAQDYQDTTKLAHFRRSADDQHGTYHDQQAERQAYHRRKSSAEVYLHSNYQGRPQMPRAETSPSVERSQDVTRQEWPLVDTSRQDSVQSIRPGTPTKASGVSRRNSTRASLAARTQRLWGRLSTGGRDSTSPPPKPKIENRKPLTKSATSADVSGQTSPGFVGMHYANPTKASSRRRSAESGGNGRHRGPNLSKTGAQAAWENKSGSASNGRGEAERRETRTWRA
ncbi:hypothetical protein B9Z65_5851 [Elsinoe australis]|uniref:Centrosomin N-terminal motif 1 domain-containing protein n=1 Tax=Elsinoe australis TaxID=40998 RepID=A0A2P7YJ89_9PEZI|nr:hypothetical protein B9Z65_5851 [Elsinoe australis]